MRWSLAAYGLVVLVAAPWSLATALTLFPVTDVSVDLTHLVHACRAALTSHDVSAADAALLAALLASVSALGWSLLRLIGTSTRSRRQQRDLIDLLTEPLDDAGSRTRLLAHEVPLAYCVPGRGSRIVVTTGARAVLAPGGLEVVLRHERAHLRGHHHLVLLWSRALGALPLRVFRVGHRETAQLVQMLADDAVRDRAGRLSLAHAVLAMGDRGPAGSLCAGTGSPRRSHGCSGPGHDSPAASWRRRSLAVWPWWPCPGSASHRRWRRCRAAARCRCRPRMPSTVSPSPETAVRPSGPLMSPPVPPNCPVGASQRRGSPCGPISGWRRRGRRRR